MIVCYAGTRNLYDGMVTSIASLMDHNEPKRIYILAEDDDIPRDLPDICEVINVSELQWKYFPKTCANRRSMFTYMAMMRAAYCDLLPVEKVIQLDIDTVICDSLEPIWNIDLTDKWFAAVPEYEAHYNPWAKACYFNIGVCVYNLDQMRRDGAQQMMINLLNRKKMMCVEQDALNYYGVPDKAVIMPLRFNECFATGETDDPAIVHYAGSFDWFNNDATHRHEYLKRYKERCGYE